MTENVGEALRAFTRLKSPFMGQLLTLSGGHLVCTIKLKGMANAIHNRLFLHALGQTFNNPLAGMYIFELKKVLELTF